MRGQHVLGGASTHRGDPDARSQYATRPRVRRHCSDRTRSMLLRRRRQRQHVRSAHVGGGHSDHGRRGHRHHRRSDRHDGCSDARRRRRRDARRGAGAPARCAAAPATRCRASPCSSRPATTSASTPTSARSSPPPCSATRPRSTFVDLETADRFTALQSGSIDVLIRNTTWTASRDGTEGATFLHPTFYDGQGMMVAADSGFAEPRAT